MSCDTYQKYLQPWLRGELSEAQAMAVQAHVAGCYSCARIVESESFISQALKSNYPVPEPSAGFESRVLAAATAGSPAAGRRRSLSFPVAGGAVAAALALGIALGVGLQPDPGPDITTVEPAVDSEPGGQQVQTVRFAFNAAKALDNVVLTVELPSHVEMADYPGHQTLSWNVSLDRGENIVNLPLNVLFPGEGELVARLDDGERKKTFRTRLTGPDGAETEGSMAEPML